MTMTHDRSSERGSAMIVVMVILVALLSAGAVAVRLQMGDTQSTGLIKSGRSALYCAERGLNEARPIVGEHTASWDPALTVDTSDEPEWYPIELEWNADHDGPEARVTILDNDDERPLTDNDREKDSDLAVYIISECLEFPQTPRKVLEFVSYQGIGESYRNQAGQGSSNTGNMNE